MAIYLDNQTGYEMKRLLRKEIASNPRNFIAPRLLKMVEADDERKEQMAHCEHDWNPMTGKHIKCNKCSALKDGHEQWTSDEFLKRKQTQ